MKQKAETYKKKRIVMGDENLVTNSEIHIKDVVKDLYGDTSSGGSSAPSNEEWIYWDVSKVSVDNNHSFRWLAHLINAGTAGIRAGGNIDSVYATKWATNLNCPHSDEGISDSPILMKEYMTMTPLGDGKTVKTLIEEIGFVEITKEEFYKLY